MVDQVLPRVPYRQWVLSVPKGSAGRPLPGCYETEGNAVGIPIPSLSYCVRSRGNGENEGE